VAGHAEPAPGRVDHVEPNAHTFDIIKVARQKLDALGGPNMTISNAEMKHAASVTAAELRRVSSGTFLEVGTQTTYFTSKIAAPAPSAPPAISAPPSPSGAS
jgi:hypothetical protein